MIKRIVYGIVLASALAVALGVSGCGSEAKPIQTGEAPPPSPYPDNQPPGPPGGPGATSTPGASGK